MDTGADISIVKASSLRTGTEIFTNDKVLVSGISDEALQTIGTMKSYFSFPNEDFHFKFHVMDHDIGFSEIDGILGRDVMYSLKSVINLKEKILQLEYKNDVQLYEIRDVNVNINKFEDEQLDTKNINNKNEDINKFEDEQQDISKIICNKNSNKNILHFDPNHYSSELCEFDTTIPVSNEYTTELNCNVHICKGFSNKDFKYEENNITEKKDFRNNTKNKSRWENLKNEIKLDTNLNIESKKELNKIISKYEDIFYLEGDRLSCADVVKHCIQLTTDKPIFVRQYPLPQIHREEINKQVNKLLEEGIIEPSVSAFNNPILLVPKKSNDNEKKFRLVVDFRKLNEKTNVDSYPIPNIAEILDQLGNSIYFSSLDLASGYHQIPMNEKDKEKTSFSTSFGKYQYVRMPFGLSNAPSTFMRYMNNIFVNLQGNTCFIYLDDIIVHGKTLEEHNSRLEEVFEVLRRHNLKLQPNKCHFLKSELNYLGHIISSNGILPNKNNIKAIENFPIPKTIKQLQSFLGMANYYRKFVPNFAKICLPLYKILMEKKPTLSNTCYCKLIINRI